MVKKIIEKTIREHNLINAGEHIVIGLSGGPDSVCLFNVLKELEDVIGFTLHAVHVNHGFRPGDADEDQQYVELLCREKGVDCASFIYDCNAIAKEEGLSSEEAGRKVRYKAFYQVAGELVAGGVPESSVKIAVAQNADDQAETVLFRLIRGTGPDGLAGMAYSRMEGDVCVIRPLLDVWRKDIEAYCSEMELEPRTDKTNLQPLYTRNKIRLEMIPYLQEKFNPNIMEALNRLSRIAGEDKEYLWRCAEDAYAALEIAPGILKQKELEQLPPPVRHRVMMKALQMQGLEQDVTFAHLEAADRILGQTGESKTAEFPEGYRMTVRYGEAAFYRSEDAADRDGHTADCADQKCYENVSFSVKVLQKDEFHAKDNSDVHGRGKSGQTAVFDYDKIRAVHGDAQAVLRTRREGDYLAISGGRKKIQNLFVDMKIPKEHRDHVLMVAIGSEILWLPEQAERSVIKSRYSNRYKLDIDTKKCLVLELDCEI